MGERAAHLVAKFEQVNREIMMFAERCSTEEWRLITDAEQWPVGVVLRHIVRSFAVYPTLIQRVASGEAMPTQYNWDDIHRSNAQQAKEWADGSKEEAITLLQTHSGELTKTLRSLTDAQLDHSSVSPLIGKELTTEQVAEGMIEHARIHLDSARRTVGNQEKP